MKELPRGSSERDTPGTASGAVLISGCSTGIGRAIAYDLIEHGWQVFATVRTEDDLVSLRAQAPHAENLHPLLLDVTQSQSITRAREEVELQLGTEGRLWAVINNAGIALSGPLEEVDLMDLRYQLEVNVIGLVAVTQAFLPLLRRSKGRLINMGSIAGRVAPPFLGAYATSKFAIEGLSDIFRRELLPWDIRVILLEPGTTQSAIWDKGLDAAQQKLSTTSPYYSYAMNALKIFQQDAKTHAMPASAIARVVRRVLVAPDPRPRYPILRGRAGALFARLLPVLSDRFLDSRLAHVFALKSMGTQVPMPEHLYPPQEVL